ncbi:unnamed protein product [marine sediment metagenome]|uniref:Uncharacterized protein n=1 Tax=marine sediment metagenome TaxID=412755 RepID=X1KHG5_9ZZZZ
MESVEILTKSEVHIPTSEEAEMEARGLVFKLIICPGAFTLLDLARLNEILIAEGYMD